MADMEARREARRRRILQASEDRMNRVLGVNPSHEGMPSTQEDISTSGGSITATQTLEAKAETEQALGSGDTVLRQRIGVTENKQTVNKDTDIPNDKSVSNTVKISPVKRPVSSVNNNKTADESLNTSRITSDAKMMLKHFEFLRIILCFIVAFLCRKVLVTGYGIFYIQSIIPPYVCLEAGFFMFKHKVLHNVILPHRSSMLMGVLLLCGIKPAIIQTYNKVMGYITAATEDFAMFFFAFMVSNLFVPS